MSFDLETIYALLPAIYRIRDEEQGKPLKALLSVIAEQVAVVEENLAQLYDDQFIETCADWVIPYIGDLIGYRALYKVAPKVSSPRAEVANTIGYRRSKGTVVMLEQLAHDVTDWPAHVVEFFQLLATTQYMKHLRPTNLYAPDLREWEPLERLNTAFDTTAHTAEVRRIASRHGRYNIPNIGIFLWRLGAYPLTHSPAFNVPGDARHYLFSPLGNNAQLFSQAQAEQAFSNLSTPFDVPAPISRRVLDAYLQNFYGSSFLIMDETAGPASVPIDSIEVCDLSDVKDASNVVTGWAHEPQPGMVAVDPVLGRIAFATAPDPTKVYATFHYGFSADMGGGEYNRDATFAIKHSTVRMVPAQNAVIQDALDALQGDGLVDVTNSGRYVGPATIAAQKDKHLELRAESGVRPLLVPLDTTTVAEISISGNENSEVTLNGFLISGYTLRVSGELSQLNLLHCTLVPGQVLTTDSVPRFPAVPSLVIEAEDVQVNIDHCISGGIRVAHDSARVQITNSIVDATAEEGVAYAGTPDELTAGSPLHIENCTIIGKVHAASMELVSNAIFLARFAENDSWTSLLAPIIAERRQEGCVRFSFLPFGSRVPRRHRCQPETSEAEGRVRPQFTSLRYGDPDYAQLSQRCAIEIRQGADDETEMGAFHDLFQSQRETNLRVRLDEYLRFGLEAGIFYAT